MKVLLYVAENDKTIHLIQSKNKKYELLCNNKKKINAHRIARKLEDVMVIAPEPAKKLRCVNCEKEVKKIIKEQAININ